MLVVISHQFLPSQNHVVQVILFPDLQLMDMILEQIIVFMTLLSTTMFCMLLVHLQSLEVQLEII